MAGARAMIDRAERWIGYREGPGNSNRFSAEMGRPAESWCADFVSAVAKESGNAAYFPNTSSCSTGRAWFQRRGRLSVYPAVGAQVFFGEPGGPLGPGGEHTGVCIAYTATTITVVAGNTNDNGSPNGDGVYRRTYRRRSDYVESYGYPAYPEGLVCADPSWRGRPGVTYFGQQADERDLPRRAVASMGSAADSAADPSEPGSTDTADPGAHPERPEVEAASAEVPAAEDGAGPRAEEIPGQRRDSEQETDLSG
ncbi:hypothetical protein [Kitasatospora camelliae]|uniref:CHAP domain-containing protein n=1 Tax=Kitasatospora camelliae TaxID=3156397 RepID=A0AAU8K2X0_9ACTN